MCDFYRSFSYRVGSLDCLGTDTFHEDGEGFLPGTFLLPPCAALIQPLSEHP